MKNILFVVHESKKSGAPLLLLQLLKEFKSQDGFKIDILISKTGELDSVFKNIGDTYFYNPTYLLDLDLKSKILRKVLNTETSVSKHQHKLYKTLVQNKYDAIYFNSLGCQSMFTFLQNYPSKKLTHIHELEEVVSGMDDGIVRSMLTHSDVLISSCKTITEFLIESYNIDTRKLVENSVFLFKDRKQSIDNLESTNRRSSDAFVIGACGAVELRKGADLFVDFAIRMVKEVPNAALEFIWVGYDQTSLGDDLKAKIKAEGLEQHIKFVGSTPTPETYFKMFNLFFLSSREEAFGLVGLENAYCKNPLVSFNIKGDLPLFINKYECGKVIPKYDFNVFKTFVLELIQDSSLAETLGANGKKATVTHFNITDQAQIIKQNLLS
ncbi:glycosyltransferase family 4 protein [Formosa sp. 4Alg 33]|uniref:glycosyltransferase family 4 protein n=1 Tax=Formosa sp. 4Alg 33 TaxID=3382189 RepID=UPI003D9C0222